jgi:hypothetical protein
MLSTTCHCGAVRIEIPRKPRQLTNCNCSICRRYGVLWAYYLLREVRVQGPTQDYVWGDKRLAFKRCAACGCVVQWAPLAPQPNSRCGVNARNFDPLMLGEVRIRKLDGASSWKIVE